MKNKLDQAQADDQLHEYKVLFQKDIQILEDVLKVDEDAGLTVEKRMCKFFSRLIQITCIF
jgi:hypothetical protein